MVDSSESEVLAMPSHKAVSLGDGLPSIEERYRQLSERYENLKKDKQNLESLLDDLLQSRSWKITFPLRALIGFFRLAFPLIRTSCIPLRLNPVGDVEKTVEDTYQVTGPTPSFIVKPQTSINFAGWGLFSARVELKTAYIALIFYFDKGQGFTEANRIMATLEPGKVGSVLLNIPRGTRAIRIDPFGVEDEFSISQLSYRPMGSLQVLWAKLWSQLRPVVYRPQLLVPRVIKAWQIFREGGIHGLRLKLFANEVTGNYDEWVRRYDTLTSADCRAIVQEIEQFTVMPKISIIVPTYNTPQGYLKSCLDSVVNQLYPNWEICIADDNSSQSHVVETIEQYRRREYLAKDERIKLVCRKENGHISAATNSALELATGDYIAFLDHDDEITPDALYQVVRAINENPNLGFIYSDEDKKTGFGMRFNPYFKPDFNKELFLAQNYLCHFAVYRSDYVKQVGGLRLGLEGAQDWDLALRVTELLRPEQIVHIPHILYHWRAIEGSTAQSSSFKEYALNAGRKAIEEHLQRLQIAAQVDVRPELSHCRVRYNVVGTPSVTLVIPTKDNLGMLKRCVSSILNKTRYSNFKILIINNRSVEPKTIEYFESFKNHKQVFVVKDPHPFNYSRINNFAVSQLCDSDFVGLLNNDLEILTPGWLEEMIGIAQQPGVGAVGARLWYPGNHLQHGGVVLGIGGVAGHAHKGLCKGDPGYFNRISLIGEFSAVTAACLVVKRSTYMEVGGLNENELAVAFNDVDFCLRLRERGLRNIFTPFAECYHFESASRGYENTPSKFNRFEKEVAYMKKRWQSILGHDPYYNPNLTLLREDFSLAFPPRIEKPWRIEKPTWSTAVNE